jgi:hypothetical protein
MGYCVPPVLRLLLGPIGLRIVNPVGFRAFAVHMTLGIHQNGLVPAGADIVGYDVLGHILMLQPPGAIMLLSSQTCQLYIEEASQPQRLEGRAEYNMGGGRE